MCQARRLGPHQLELVCSKSRVRLDQQDLSMGQIHISRYSPPLNPLPSLLLPLNLEKSFSRTMQKMLMTNLGAKGS